MMHCPVRSVAQLQLVLLVFVLLLLPVLRQP